MEPLRVYMLVINNDFQWNRWREDVRDAAERLGWTVIHRGAQGAPVEEVVSEASGCDLFLWLRANRHDPQGDARAMLPPRPAIERHGLPPLEFCDTPFDRLGGADAAADPRGATPGEPWGPRRVL